MLWTCTKSQKDGQNYENTGVRRAILPKSPSRRAKPSLDGRLSNTAKFAWPSQFVPRCSGWNALHISISSGWSQHYFLHQDWRRWGSKCNSLIDGNSSFLISEVEVQSMMISILNPLEKLINLFLFQKPWCSTKVDSTGVQEVGHWGYCPLTGC